MKAYIEPGRVFGVVTAPPSKSMAHRLLLCAGLAKGQSVIDRVQPSQDILATARALEALGARVDVENGRARVTGCGGHLAVPKGPVDCGESGSTLRFFIPLLAGCGGPVRLLGHGRLMQRPQDVYARLFAQRGLPFSQSGDGLTLCGPLPPGEYRVEGGVSSQFISGLLLALPLLCADSVLHVVPPFESQSYVGLTMAAMADFGVQVRREQNDFFIPGNQHYISRDAAVEGDASQAAFLAVLGSVQGGITVTGLRQDSCQGDRVIFDILRRCGAAMTPVAGGWRFEKSDLHAVDIDLADCPDLGPILMVLGLFCQGETVIRNAGRLRVKESDRIAAMQQEVKKLGGRIEADGDTVRVYPAALHDAANLVGHNDHRVVMALTVAALAARVRAVIDGAQAVQKSWPEVFTQMKQWGAQVKTDERT
ncbi:3-phosphoshikimate 1-carboxyvinyltransferase [uncultured Ruthenibacterium sp.]|uniref:3-phosphoshikimate 1-carboxyvinyltransferase n=1 Tax=uncultured Ruthenibacterium sp. TaxID=1905347 RepID=UPI00349EA9A5